MKDECRYYGARSLIALHIITQIKLSEMSKKKENKKESTICVAYIKQGEEYTAERWSQSIRTLLSIHDASNVEFTLLLSKFPRRLSIQYRHETLISII